MKLSLNIYYIFKAPMEILMCRHIENHYIIFSTSSAMDSVLILHCPNIYVSLIYGID